MDIKKAVLAAMQEYLLPELEGLKSGQVRLETELVAVNKRLDDVNLHLVDQSRRIDAVREGLNENINAVREELNQNITETNKRLDRLYEVIVRRDEHAAIVIKINEMDHEIREIKQRLAA